MHALRIRKNSNIYPERCRYSRIIVSEIYYVRFWRLPLHLIDHFSNAKTSSQLEQMINAALYTPYKLHVIWS